MSKAKSLSERLAEIANPAPALIDPEDEYNEETKARLDRYDEDYDTSEKPVKKVVKAKPSLRQSNAILLAASDKRYAGTKVSRKDLEDEDFEEPELTSPESVEESETDEIEEFKKRFAKLGPKKSSPNQGQKLYLNSKRKVLTLDTDDDEMGDASDDEDFDHDGSEEAENGSEEEEIDEEADNENLDEDEEIDDYDENDDEDSEDEDIENGLISDLLDGDNNGNAALDDLEDTEKSKKEIKKRIDIEVKKGNSIKHQLSMWDLLLECRIKYHKTINLSNQLPQGPNGFKSFTQTPGEKDFVAAAQSAQNTIKTFLDTCLELQDALLKSSPSTKGLLNGTSKPADMDDDDEEIPSDSEEEGNEDDEQEQHPTRKKLKLEEYDQEIDNRHQNYRDFCNRTLNLWYEKTRGRAAGLQKSGFGAFDTSILKQIEGILSDKQRLLNRTRTKRSAYRILGLSEKKEKDEKPATSDDVPFDDQNKEHDDDLDAEIYDDDDFYHQLLRELIEKRTSEGGSNQVAVGKQWLEIQKLRAKAKRKVDAKASKGRRLRYHVHPKLVSFMAPFPETSWNDVAKNELFSSLFRS